MTARRLLISTGLLLFGACIDETLTPDGDGAVEMPDAAVGPHDGEAPLDSTVSLDAKAEDGGSQVRDASPTDDAGPDCTSAYPDNGPLSGAKRSCYASCNGGIEPTCGNPPADEWATFATDGEYVYFSASNGSDGIWVWDPPGLYRKLSGETPARLLFTADGYIYYFADTTGTLRRLRALPGQTSELVASNVSATWVTTTSVFWSRTTDAGAALEYSNRSDPLAATHVVTTAAGATWVGGNSTYVVRFPTLPASSPTSQLDILDLAHLSVLRSLTYDAVLYHGQPPLVADEARLVYQADNSLKTVTFDASSPVLTLATGIMPASVNGLEVHGDRVYWSGVSVNTPGFNVSTIAAPPSTASLAPADSLNTEEFVILKDLLVYESSGQLRTLKLASGASSTTCMDGGCVGACNADSDCTASPIECETTSCDTVTHTCTTMSKAAGTPCSTGVCDATARCIQCQARTDCPSSRPTCSQGICTGCGADADCAAGEICGFQNQCTRCGNGVLDTGEECEWNLANHWQCDPFCNKRTRYNLCHADADCDTSTFCLLTSGSDHGICTRNCLGICVGMPAFADADPTTFCNHMVQSPPGYGACMAECETTPGWTTCAPGLNCVDGVCQ